MSTMMARSRRISVPLSEEQFADLQSAVARGACASTAEAVQQAITEWRLRRALHTDEIERLRDLWDAGRAEGTTAKFDIERTISSARDRRR